MAQAPTPFASMDPDAFIPGLASREEPGESDPDGFIAGSVVDPPAGRGGRGNPCGRPRAAPRSGKLLAWLVGDSSGPSPAAGDEPVLSSIPAGRSIFGLGFCEWAFQAPTDEANNVHAQVSNRPGGHRAQQAWGYVQYKFGKTFELAEPFPVPSDTFDLDDEVVAFSLLTQLGQAALRDGTVPIDALLGTEFENCSVVALVEPVAMLQPLFHMEAPTIFRSVRLGAKTDWKAMLPGNPAQTTVKIWRTAQGVHTGPRRKRDLETARASMTWEDIVLELPKRARTTPAPKEGDGNGTQRPAIDLLRLLRATLPRSSLKAKGTFP